MFAQAKLSTWVYYLIDGKYSIDVVVDLVGYRLILYKNGPLWLRKQLLVKLFDSIEEGSVVLKKWNEFFNEYALMDEPFDMDCLLQE